MSSSSVIDTTLPPDWQWVTRPHEIARGSVVSKLWWRNGVPDFRAVVTKDPDGLRPGCLALVEIAWGTPLRRPKFRKPSYEMQWVSAGGIEDLPYDPLAAAAVVELEVYDWLAGRHLSNHWMRRWPDCQVGG